ncbi:MAG: glycerophosphodiester phosphodiesterase [Aquificota bacterium]|nr:MAG: glycerophosphodiester phosphodiesterase [Aquificota bacterium]
MKIEEALNTKPFGIVGHRGARGRKPENTIAAIEYGIKAGADIVEVDIRRTKDNHLILLHDSDFERLTGKKVKPSDVELSYIKENIFIKGEPVATIDEALSTVNGRACMFLEIKEPETTQQVIEHVLKHNASEWVAIISFYDDAIVEAKRLLPSVKTGLIYMKPPGRIFDAKKLGADFVLPFYRIATAKANAVAHRLRLKVVVWTINDEKTAKEMLNRKADVMATDYPDLLVEFRRNLKEKL